MQVRYDSASPDALAPHTVPVEEGLVADERSSLSPSESVERKLLAMLKDQSVPVSYKLQGTLLNGRRSR